MKTCFKCNTLKPLSEFYVHRQMADGHLGKCKSCTKADTAHRAEMLSQDPVWAWKEAERNRAKAKRQRESGRLKYDPITKSASIRRYRQRFPEKHAAHNAVANAIRTGAIKREPCCKCGRKAHAHHDHYSKPLDVMWLCPEHHALRHVEQRWEKKLKTLTANKL